MNIATSKSKITTKPKTTTESTTESTTDSTAKTAKPKSTKSKTKSTSIPTDVLDSLKADPVHFVLTTDSDMLIKIIKEASDDYYNYQPIITDEVFDFLLDTINVLDPQNPILKKVGAKVVSKDKVKLPYYMGSMDKIKPTDQNVLTKWLDKYTGPYVYSDKLDGVSGLLVCSNNKLNLYTRGDGIEGTNITHLIKYIKKLSKLIIPNNMAIRGELIMSKTNFTKYSEKMANARNMVSGLVNSKTLDTEAISNVDFVAYELINPWIISQSEQWQILNSLGLDVVNNGSDIDVNFENLSELLSERKSLSDYEIDGIIVSVNNLPSKRSINTNPEYAFAFKDSNLLERAHVQVNEVVWVISKDGYIKPRLNLVPTKLSGVVISSVTALHAKYVLENKLGPGAVVEIIRSGDVIPKIEKVIKPASTNEAQMPDMEYEWTKTGVDIIVSAETIDQKIRGLTFFFKKLNIKNIDESTVKKLVDVGIDNLNAILNLKKSDLENVEGFKERMIEKIYTNIKTRIQTLNMLDLMSASNVFGHGIGERKLRKIMETYPDIIKLYSDNEDNEIIDLIVQIDGFDVKTAEYFANGLTKFINLFNSLDPQMRKQLRLSINQFIEAQEEIDQNISNFDNKFADQNILFSGFRNKDWEKVITDNGGKVASSVSSKTTLLVTTQEDLDKGTNSKIKKAQELGIPIMTNQQFEQNYIL